MIVDPIKGYLIRPFSFDQKVRDQLKNIGLSPAAISRLEEILAEFAPLVKIDRQSTRRAISRNQHKRLLSACRSMVSELRQLSDDMPRPHPALLNWLTNYRDQLFIHERKKYRAGRKPDIIGPFVREIREMLEQSGIKISGYYNEDTDKGGVLYQVLDLAMQSIGLERWNRTRWTKLAAKKNMTEEREGKRL
jgi:hypothetical protein